jgi:Tol biopolymer transport system component
MSRTKVISSNIFVVAFAAGALSGCVRSELAEELSLSGLSVSTWDWEGHIGFAWKRTSVVTLDSTRRTMSQVKPHNFAGLWTDISLSPDATKVAYAAIYAEDPWPQYHYRITLQNSDGSHPTKLPTGQNHQFSPVFSPDGEELFFIESAAVTSRLLRSSLTGENPTEVSTVNIWERVCWHPSGEFLAFSHNRGIYWLRKDGTELQPIVMAEPGEFLYSPSFSPEGDRLAYVARRGPNDTLPPVDPPYHFRIYTIGSDGTERRLVVDLQEASYYDDVWVSWSPHAEQLAYNFYDPSEMPKPTGAQLYVINADGSQRRLVTSVQGPGGWVSAPHWVR